MLQGQKELMLIKSFWTLFNCLVVILAEEFIKGIDHQVYIMGFMGMVFSGVMYRVLMLKADNLMNTVIDLLAVIMVAFTIAGKNDFWRQHSYSIPLLIMIFLVVVGMTFFSERHQKIIPLLIVHLSLGSILGRLFMDVLGPLGHGLYGFNVNRYSVVGSGFFCAGVLIAYGLCHVKLLPTGIMRMSIYVLFVFLLIIPLADIAHNRPVLDQLSGFHKLYSLVLILVSTVAYSYALSIHDGKTIYLLWAISLAGISLMLVSLPSQSVLLFLVQILALGTLWRVGESLLYWMGHINSRTMQPMDTENFLKKRWSKCKKFE